jgi:UDP-2-acetamido-3-amino-2,3-dideoxy-glucuronate N-acetyltransferase
VIPVCRRRGVALRSYQFVERRDALINAPVSGGRRIERSKVATIHRTAEVSPEASIGSGTRIWHYVQVREGVSIGRDCIIGKGAYVDLDVVIGNCVKIQNACQVYHGVTLEDGVFLGPGVILTNDKRPRAITPDGTLKTDEDWVVGKTLIKRGAAVGAGAVVLPGITVGTFALIGAGSVVTRNVPDYGLVWGNPARLRGFACPCGAQLRADPISSSSQDRVSMACPLCGTKIQVPAEAYEQIEEE